MIILTRDVCERPHDCFHGQRPVRRPYGKAVIFEMAIAIEVLGVVMAELSRRAHAKDRTMRE